MNQRRHWGRTFAALTILATLLVALSGCTTTSRSGKLEPKCTIGPDSQIEMGAVTNESGETVKDVDLCLLLAGALDESLTAENLLAVKGATSGKYILTAKIVEYEPGSAMKRWVVPGWGATVLAVQCDLTKVDGGAAVGSFVVRRKINMGGLATIGGWKTVFQDVAQTVVKQMKDKSKQS